MSGCIGQIRIACSGEEIMAPCVRYEEELPKISSLKGVCNNIEDTTKDIYNILNENLNLDKLGKKCLKYNNDPKLIDILLKQEEEICNLKNRENKQGNMDSICTMSIEDCGLDLTGLVDKCTGVKPKTLGELLVIIIDKLDK